MPNDTGAGEAKTCAIQPRRDDMSDQTHRGLREDAATKRREYLQRKRKIYAAMFAWGLISVGVLVLGVSIIVCTGWLSWFFRRYDVLVLGITLVVLLVLPFLCGFMGAYLEAGALRNIEYVPPVHKQLAALPADEVLLRSSDQPATEPSELLRAAQEGTGKGAEELLRPNDNRAI